MLTWKNLKKLSSYTKDGFRLELADFYFNKNSSQLASFQFVLFGQFSLASYEVPISFVTYIAVENCISINLRQSEIEEFRQEFLLPMSEQRIDFEPSYTEFIESHNYIDLFQFSEGAYKPKVNFETVCGIEVCFADSSRGIVYDVWFHLDDWKLAFQVLFKNNPERRLSYFLESKDIENIDSIQKRAFSPLRAEVLKSVPITQDPHLFKNKLKELVQHISMAI
ncbi:MAG: hypothetical protein L6Q37_04235 [Bdellovibrionaceae bacterium]|nr:hypothetical protein [Pseudobdellovibrionaceae bacterium]NUM59624.1 hypothetical protein [Pseudobdellovibrionaceae bacterium]